MKTIYKAILVTLIVLAVIFVILIYTLSLGQSSSLENVIQGLGIFVALAAAIIALAGADPKNKQIKATVEILSISDKAEYHKNDLPNEIKNYFASLPEVFESHRIHIKITNTSDFTIEKPVLAFRLPIEKQHPHKANGTHFLSFNSNLFNSQSEFRMLEFANTRILSNNNLPYWNPLDEVIIWIRMVLDNKDSQPFNIDISLNGENADGLTQKIKLDPSTKSWTTASA
jgi:hypothetical protein